MRMFTFVAACVVGSVTLAQPIDDETLSGMMLERAAAWQQLEAEQRLNLATVTALNNELMAKLDLSSLTVDQLRLLAENSAFVGIDLTMVTDVLDRLAAEPTADGIRSAVLKLQLTQGQPDAAMAMTMMTHSGAPALMATDDGALLMQVIGMTLPDMSAEQREGVYSFMSALPDDVSNGPLAYSEMVVSGLAKAVQTEQLPAHQAMVAHVKGIAETRLSTAEEPGVKQGLDRLVSFLNGNYAQGKLIGSPMPPLDIAWSSEESLTSFAALRGKVIVLDFWATWCGPCIGSFPNVRHLQSHYDAHDVVIVGVTSIQGQVVNGPNGRVMCDGDEAKEYAETQAFMDFHSMSWPVVFTEQDVFNAAYGVSGIPHVTIIDTKGVVRASGLHPASPLEEKTAIIDGLLAEAGLSVPKAPEDG